MNKSLFVAVVIAVACSGVAMAKDLKQDKKATAPTVAATQMSDAEMDKVTAGNGAYLIGINAPRPITQPSQPGLGNSPVCFNCIL